MSKLYIIPTPIGNLDDMSFRGVDTLKKVDIVLAEDTRSGNFLLNHFNIEKKIFSHHKFNEHKSVEHLAGRIQSGETMALISEAGTPGISDPGFLLVRTCIAAGIEVITLPGATALIPALVNSGLPCDKFCFEGFLPQKKGRQKRIKELSDETRTMIFYESPYRLIKALKQFTDFFGSERRATVSREISKVHEETRRGTLQQLYDYYNEQNVKGEIVIVIEGKKN